MMQAISDNWYLLDPLRYLADRFSPLVVVPFAQIGSDGVQLRFAVRLRMAEFFNHLCIKRDPTAGCCLQPGLLADSLGDSAGIGGVIARNFLLNVFRLERICQHTTAKIQGAQMVKVFTGYQGPDPDKIA